MPRYALFGFLFAFLFPIINGATAQVGATPPGQENRAALSGEEERDFDARLRAAATDQDRARIQAQRQQLIDSRLRGQGAEIPPSARELNQQPLMPDVPTPPLDRPRPTGNTLPGGALSNTGAGTSPAINPVTPGPEGR